MGFNFSRLSERSLSSHAVSETVREIDAELEHHLEEASASLVSEGVSPADARAEALRKLGDVGALRAELVGHAIGAQRPRFGPAALAVAATVLLAVVGVVAYQHTRTADMRDRLASVSEELTVLRAEMRSKGPADRLPLAQRLNVITVDGEVGRRLTWVFEPREDVTLRALLHRTGGLLDSASGRISVCRVTESGIETPVYLSASEWADPNGPDPILDGSYYIYAERVETASSDGVTRPLQLASAAPSRRPR